MRGFPSLDGVSSVWAAGNGRRGRVGRAPEGPGCRGEAFAARAGGGEQLSGRSIDGPIVLVRYDSAGGARLEWRFVSTCANSSWYGYASESDSHTRRRLTRMRPPIFSSFVRIVPA